MKRIGLVAQVSLTATVVASLGCATARSPSSLVVYTHPDRKVVVGGLYSVNPPEGSGWELKKSSGELTHYQRRDSTTHSCEASVQLHDYPGKEVSQGAVIGLLDTNLRKFKSMPRHREVQADIRADTAAGPYCARSRYRFDDLEASDRSGEGFLHQEAVDLVCVHPKWPGVLVIVRYSERGKPDELGPSFDELSERFLRGFKLL